VDTVKLVMELDAADAIRLHDILVTTWFPTRNPLLDEEDFGLIDKLTYAVIAARAKLAAGTDGHPTTVVVDKPFIRPNFIRFTPTNDDNYVDGTAMYGNHAEI
jgi:hypothetical protein